jgi:hypothetical protein
VQEGKVYTTYIAVCVLLVEVVYMLQAAMPHAVSVPRQLLALRCAATCCCVLLLLLQACGALLLKLAACSSWAVGHSCKPHSTASCCSPAPS